MKVETMQIVTCQGWRRLRRVMRHRVPTPLPQLALATWENALARRLALARSEVTGKVRISWLPATERARARRREEAARVCNMLGQCPFEFYGLCRIHDNCRSGGRLSTDSPPGALMGMVRLRCTIPSVRVVTGAVNIYCPGLWILPISDPDRGRISPSGATMVTLKEIAKAVGVSTATVSRVLNFDQTLS